MMNISIPSEMTFPREEFAQRMERLRKRIRDKDLQVLLIHSPRAQAYLTGFETLNTWEYRCLLVPADGEPTLVVRDLEEANVYLTSTLQKTSLFRGDQSPIGRTAQLLAELGLNKAGARVGIENDSLLPQIRYDELNDALRQTTVINGTPLVSGLYMIKSPREVAAIKRAGKITDQGIKEGLAQIGEGKTDQDVAAAGYEALIRGGSEYMSLQPIVTSGKRSGIPHSTHKRIPLKRGDPVFLEFGACVSRYNAPLMRSGVVGKPSADIERTANCCLAGLERALETIKAGATADSVAQVVWKEIKKDRPNIYYHGVIGYSIGLGFPPNWGDAPYRQDTLDSQLLIMKDHQTVLEPGMVFHLPIACRDIGNYCVGFSETIAVTEKGCDVMSSLSRTFSIA